jgi:hypothetical protein
MSVGEISLEGRWFDGIDRQNGEQDRVSAERFFVRSNYAAAGFGDGFRGLGRSPCGLLESAFRWAEALCARFGFARPPPGRCTLDHSRDSTPVSTSTSSISDRASAAPANNDGLAAQLWIITLLDGGVKRVHVYVDGFPDELAKCSIKLAYRKAGMR